MDGKSAIHHFINSENAAILDRIIENSSLDNYSLVIDAIYRYYPHFFQLLNIDTITLFLSLNKYSQKVIDTISKQSQYKGLSTSELFVKVMRLSDNNCNIDQTPDSHKMNSLIEQLYPILETSIEFAEFFPDFLQDGYSLFFQSLVMKYYMFVQNKTRSHKEFTITLSKSQAVDLYYNYQRSSYSISFIRDAFIQKCLYILSIHDIRV